MMVALYARVSTRKQDEAAQLPRLRAMAESRGYGVYREYTDEASAKDANRLGWKALMQDASERRFDAVLVTKLDRVMRSLVQLNITMEDLQTYGVSLICADIGEIDLRSPMGKVQMQIIGAIAEWEREIIVQRTKEGMEARRARGVRMGRRRRDDVPISAAAALRMDGRSWKSISDDLHIPKTTLSRKDEIEAAIAARSEKAPPFEDGSEREGAPGPLDSI
ncbi:MAG: recombinase family protein [Candidatus Methanomethylophilaceae archaeon]|nr:recombinase family protein [Candidatus Methanomethylophilaceae archaeon]